jgi:hypothetical protein
MLSNNEARVGSKPKEFGTPMMKKHCPEIDTSDFLDALGNGGYPSFMESIQ